MTKYSKETYALAALTWEGDIPHATNFLIDDSVKYEGQIYKFTEETYEELLKYQDEAPKKFKVKKTGKLVNLVGIRV
nr:hypothetical protein [Mycobacterium sp. E3298]